MERRYKINLDIINNNTIRVPEFILGDTNTPILEFSLMSCNVPIKIETGTFVRCLFLLDNGNKYESFNTKILDSDRARVEVVIPSAVLSFKGYCKVQLRLNKDDSVLSAFPLAIRVTEGISDGDLTYPTDIQVRNFIREVVTEFKDEVTAEVIKSINIDLSSKADKVHKHVINDISDLAFMTTEDVDLILGGM